MTTTLLGRCSWSVDRDSEGHRDFSVKWLIASSTPFNGPQTVLSTPGLPVVGSTWAYGNDLDAWAFCLPDAMVRPVIDKERNLYWTVSQKFSTRPQNRCQTETIENPIAEPPKISGGFVKYTEEKRVDRHGNKLAYSNHQLMEGAITEFDNNRPTVVIEINFPAVDLSLISGAVDTLNDSLLWGMDPRHVKLSNASWARRLYGVCNYYYSVRYEFDIRGDGFDRTELDRGTRVLAPGGNVSDPRDFIQYKDCRGTNQKILLDGTGNALADGATPHEIVIEGYDETNLLLLGIPTSL